MELGTLERYIAYLRDVRSMSPRSVRIYPDAVRYLAEVIDPTAAGGRSEVRNALLALKEARGWGQQTLYNKGKYLLNFYAWAHSEGLIPINPWPFNEFKPPRPKEAPHVTEQIYRAILADPDLALRYRAAMMLLWDTGVRASELCSLDIENFVTHEGGHLIHVPREKSKGGYSDRFIPVTLPTAGLLMVQIGVAKARAQPAMFLNRIGRRMDQHDLWKAVAKAGLRAGFKSIHPKGFRHAFGMRMLAAGVPQLVVMGWMGHSSITMTNRYIHQSPQTSLQFYPASA